MSLAAIAKTLQADALQVMGLVSSDEADAAGAPLPCGIASLVLIGPQGPDFWPHVTAAPEWGDGRPDPLDRWSRRVIGRLACDLGAKALFPFGGPPYHPFIAWAKASGRAFTSPVELLVHDQAGLMLSYRGALALRQGLQDEGAKSPAPCLQCLDKPCLSACPIGALGADGYDVPACRAHVVQGGACALGGCLVRRACPASKGYGRLEVQSAYHMRQFTS